MDTPTVIYTKTDEAPLLATYSLLPIIHFFTSKTGINLELKDISLAGRILAKFPKYITNKQFKSDDLEFLRRLIETKEDANIIKLPNISASLPQLVSAINELQQKGYSLPDYPERINTTEDKKIKQLYDSVKGSAVNPVLRQGNSDRRIPKVVKNFSQKFPHHLGTWSAKSKTHIATMSEGDFRHNEKSLTIDELQVVSIQFTNEKGTKQTLKSNISLCKAEVIDTTVMERKVLKSFLSQAFKDAKNEKLLFSLHLKSTMMKVADPIIFGIAVDFFFEDVFHKHQEILKEIGFNPNNGLSDLFVRIENLPYNTKNKLISDIQEQLDEGPLLAMVNSDKGITNLHYPNDIIIDASLPAMIKNSGKMWDKNGTLQDTKAVIPDSSYADLYQTVIEFCKKKGSFNPRTMGSVSTVGLMAMKAEEYGSHDKTFQLKKNGKITIENAKGKILVKHNVKSGDIWRMCRVKDIAINNWISLAIERAKTLNCPVIFWLDNTRAHDIEIIKKVERYLTKIKDNNLDIHILPVKEATLLTLETIHKGEDIIAACGNVLRDYLTDLFPILEVGTSAKMLSIVPLLNGGKLFETGSGGSAPKHVTQFIEEGHLRWDSLGEFLALSYSLKFLGDKFKHTQVKILASAVNEAIERYLNHRCSPSRKVGELDTRGSHFYFAMYWAAALVRQTDDLELNEKFYPFYRKLVNKQKDILSEINAMQGKKINLQGYYSPDDKALIQNMRPSKYFNKIIELSEFNRKFLLS